MLASMIWLAAFFGSLFGARMFPVMVMFADVMSFLVTLFCSVGAAILHLIANSGRLRLSLLVLNSHPGCVSGKMILLLCFVGVLLVLEAVGSFNSQSLESFSDFFDVSIGDSLMFSVDGHC